MRKTDTMDKLYGDSLDGVRRVLKEGKKAVVVAHRDILSIAAEYFTVVQRHDQRVHKSLTRRILVLSHEQEGAYNL